MRRWQLSILLIAAIAFLSGCAAGAPPTTSQPTATGDTIAVATSILHSANGLDSSPTATSTATREVAEEPTPTDRPRPTKTRTPKPKKPTKTPTMEPTTRPDPPPPSESGLSRVFVRGVSGRKEVALTFDAGADRGYAEEILDLLADYGVVASFGITGMWTEENPDLVQRMVDEGHMLFNHTYSHRSFTGFSTSESEAVLTREARQKELLDTAEIIFDLTGYNVAPYFRPPYADYNDEILTQIAEVGYWITLQYTCDSMAWAGTTAAEIVAKCGDNAEPGDIILLHVGAAAAADTEALPGIIESLLAQDFDLVTAEEIIQD